MYSPLHPLARQSQLPLEFGAWAVIDSGFPREALQIPMQSITLCEGEYVFIPAFHLHLVEVPKSSEVISISVNQYVDSHHKSILASIYSYPTPPPHELAAVLKIIFERLFVDIAQVARNVLVSRYSRLDHQDIFIEGNISRALKVGQENRSIDECICARCCIEKPNFNAGPLIEHFAELHTVAADAFEMLCADFLEVIAARVVGVTGVYQFLQCLALS